MALYTKNPETKVVSTTDDGTLDDAVSGLKAPFMGENELVDRKSVWAALGLYGSLIAAGTSMLTRKRAASGAKPIAGVFF